MKTNKKQLLYKIVSFLLILGMMISILGTSGVMLVKADDESDIDNQNIVYISTAEDFVELSKKCENDTWSVGKKIVLTNDISLKDVVFSPIPYFAGAFDGQGYTISDLEISAKIAPAGLFATTSPSAVIENLTVKGTIMPEGEKESVGGIVGQNSGVIRNVEFSGVVSGEVAIGGIAGINTISGMIENATVKGNLFGEHGTGGIVGQNYGCIRSCKNEASVNNTSVDNTISLDDISTNFLQNLYAWNSSDMLGAFTDTGGIAGYSNGKIIDSNNDGIIGYPRVGYNTGGIVGRQCGYIDGCRNDGKVYGRKDIGGITGHTEPFLDVEIDVTDISIVERELKVLKDQMNQTIDDAEASEKEVTAHLDKVNKDYVEPTIDLLEELLLYLEEHQVEIPDNIELPDNIEIPDNVERPEYDEVQDNATEYAESYKEIVEAIISNLRIINQELSLAGEAFSDGSTQLSENLEALTEQTDKVSQSVERMINNIKDFGTEDVIADTSDQNIDKVTYGKIINCVNYGEIAGDYNVGGITGIISIEYELDPEDDTTMDISWEEQKSYEAKAILSTCVNKGKIVAKKDNAAGICGQMDLGYIVNCQAYGVIMSESGSYVAGIAGVANSKIDGCVAKCRLSGKNYVGGIIGCGFADENISSEVLNCISLVYVEDYTQFVGAIAGDKEGKFCNNYFVSNELQGINRVNYVDVAQKISYEELMEMDNIPEELKKFTLYFVADEKVIKSVDFSYGESFTEEVFPEVPAKTGYGGEWDTTELENLCFDTVVTAEYTLYITALESEMQRENGRPIFLVEGNFDSEDSVMVSQEVISEDIKNGMSLFGEVKEYWKVSFSDDGQKRHSIRFLPEEGLTNYSIYVKEDGKWNKVKTESFGSYETFQVLGIELEIVIIDTAHLSILSIACFVLLIACIGMLILFERKTHFLKKIYRRVVLRVGIKRFLVIIAIVMLAITSASIAYVAMSPRLQIVKELSELSADVLAGKNQKFKMDLVADVGANHVELDSHIYLLNHSGEQVLVLEDNGHSIYLLPDALFLENGKGYRVVADSVKGKNIFEQLTKLYSATDVSRTEELDKVVYSISTSGKDAIDLMSMLVPSSEGQIASVEETQIRMVAKDGTLEQVEIEGKATLKNALDTPMQLSVILSEIGEVKPEEYALPKVIANAIKQTDKSSLPVIGEEFYRLIIAWVDFQSTEKSGVVEVDVACGSLNVNLNHDWQSVSKGFAEIENRVNLEKLPDIIYELSMNCEYEFEKIGSTYVFNLKVSEEEIETLAKTIAPEISNMPVNMENGVLEIRVTENKISSISVVLDGKLKVLLSDVDTTIKTELRFE